MFFRGGQSNADPQYQRACKKTCMEHMTKICQLWRPTYLPPRAQRKAALKGAGVAGEVARYHGRFWFCCAHALMCGFQYKCPPSPLTIQKFFCARARKPAPSAQQAARTTAPPPKCHKTATFGCRWPQNRGIPKKIGNIFAGADLPTYLPCVPCTFFCMPLDYIDWSTRSDRRR